jgi:hypothetical protein
MTYALVILSIGIVLLAIAAMAEGKWNKILLHVIRDIGIAFIVAVVVTGVFELYERTRQTEVSIERQVDARMGDQLTPEVWKDIKEQILDRHLLRRNAEVRVRFEKTKGLLPDQQLAHVEFSYDLYNISSPDSAITVRHTLAFPQDPKSKIPRFDLTSVEGPDNSRATTYTAEMLDQASRKGYEELNLKIDKNQRVHIIGGRTELVNVPGVYNLYMNEYTEGFRLHVEGAEGFQVKVLVRPYGHPEVLAQAGRFDWSFGRLLLPGQGIELIFQEKR